MLPGETAVKLQLSLTSLTRLPPTLRFVLLVAHNDMFVMIRGGLVLYRILRMVSNTPPPAQLAFHQPSLCSYLSSLPFIFNHHLYRNFSHTQRPLGKTIKA